MPRAVRAKTLGARLFEARQAAGLSMRALAEKAGVTHTTVNDIEKGHHLAATDVVEGLAQALGVSPCWLAYGIGPKEDTDLVAPAQSPADTAR